MNRIFYYLLLILICSGGLAAQIPAPEIICVENGDEIIWEIPVITCGSLTGYEIFMSTDPAGPFTSVGVISDPSVTSFLVSNATGEVRYYYIVSVADCPGEPQISSDTLDNRPPQPTPITAVTVENGQVVIVWDSLQQPDIDYYVIHRTEGVGNIPIDTIYSGTTYTDTAAEPGMGSEFYYLTAVDKCGQPNNFDLYHRTIFLQYDINSCGSGTELFWNEYENWSEGVENYNILLSVDNGPEQIIASGDASTLNFNYNGLERNRNYCFRIEAVAAGPGSINSYSNEICFTAANAVPDNSLFIRSITLSEGGEPLIRYEWMPFAMVDLYSLYRVEGGDTVFIFEEIPQNPLPDSEEFLDRATGGPAGYYLNASGPCDTSLQDEATHYIWLNALSEDEQVLLSWNEYVSPYLESIEYEILKYDQSGMSQVISTTSGTTHTDPVDVDLEGDLVCYRIRGLGVMNFPTGPDTIIVYSNKVNLAPTLKVYIPNAFHPGSVNSTFKPIFVNPSIVEDYEMHIFSRGGNQVFVSNNINQAWDGRWNDRAAPMGVYVYYMKATTLKGETWQYSGSLHLLR